LSFQMIALYFNFVKLEKKPKMNSLTNFLSRFVRTQSFQMNARIIQGRIREIILYRFYTVQLFHC